MCNCDFFHSGNYIYVEQGRGPHVKQTHVNLLGYLDLCEEEKTKIAVCIELFTIRTSFCLFLF